MQLEPGEKLFLAYFPTSKAAERAADELKKAELGTVQVDRISRYEANIDSHYSDKTKPLVSTLVWFFFLLAKVAAYVKMHSQFARSHF